MNQILYLEGPPWIKFSDVHSHRISLETFSQKKTLGGPSGLEAGTFKSFLKDFWKIVKVRKARMAEMADFLNKPFLKHAHNQSRKG